MWRRLFIMSLSCLVVSGPLLMNRSADALATQVVISAIKTDGANTQTTPTSEYVDLTNVSDQTIDLTGWQLVYAKPTTLLDENCRTSDWSADEVTSLDLDGSLDAGQATRFAMRMLDDKSGAVRLTDPAGTVEDLVGWGGEAKCAEGETADIPGDHEMLQRCTTASLPQDTNDNATDFSRTADDAAVPSCPDTAPSDPAPAPDYPGLLITELLPDPAPPQSDSRDEFIELYNFQSFAVSTKDYVLHTSSNSASYSYTMPDISLQPGEYRAFYSGETGLSLVNSTAYAWLTDPGSKVVDETSWYSDLGSDNAWALINGVWRQTNNPTPSAANRLAAVGGRGAEAAQSITLKSCPTGKYRNPATNRCKAVTLVSTSLVACKPGQQRNPATNRCRSSVAAGSVLAACSSDQQRNPATNRCRKLVPGAAGVNNAALAAGSAANTVSKLNYTVLGLISSAALGYGIYEYRQDALHTLLRIRNRLGRSRLLK